MPLAVALTSDIAKNAGVAYVHYLSFMLCFGALVLERKLIKRIRIARRPRRW